jgi:hypothetical protein
VPVAAPGLAVVLELEAVPAAEEEPEVVPEQAVALAAAEEAPAVVPAAVE